MLDDTSHNLSQLRPTETIRRGTASQVSLSAALLAPAALDEAPPPPVRELSLRWHVVRHKPFEGARARNAIRRLGFECHWPRVISRRPRHDDVIEPLFQGYLFAQFDACRGGWSRINRLDEVVAIIGLRELGRPLALPRGEVEALIARAGAIDCAIDTTGDMAEPPFSPHLGGRLLDVVSNRHHARSQRAVIGNLADLEAVLDGFLEGERAA